jgi:hypothetical protein
MHTATVVLKSAPGSAYQPGAEILSPKGDQESWDDWEAAHWRERAHCDEAGRLIIPAITFKRVIEAGAAYNPRKLKGLATFTKLFERAIIVTEPLVLKETRETVKGETIAVPADGMATSKSTMKSSRVRRTFPTVKEWSGTVVFNILDDRITEQVFKDTLDDAGMYIGIGTWRAQRGGLNGRFEVVSVKWK